MRTSTIHLTTIKYPDKIVWLRDSNVIKLESQVSVGAEIIITEPTGNTKTLTYLSDVKTLLFTLDDALMALYDDNLGNWNVRITIYENNIQMGITSFSMKVLNGKSFITRSHGLSQTIYAYSEDDLYKVNIYSSGTGLAVLGNWTHNCYPGINGYDLRNVITDNGEYSLCLVDNTVPSLVSITDALVHSPTSAEIILDVTAGESQQTTKGGDIWVREKQIFPVCHKIIYQEPCEDYNFVELRYTDTDGCFRYLGGKLIEEVDTVKDSGWHTLTTEVWKNKPNRWINSSVKTVKISFSDIEKNAYPGDLFYSDSVKMKIWNGEWQDVRLKTDSLTTTDEETMDFEIEVYTHEL